jgi:hypothetical protein
MPAPATPLPTFLVIGAQKSATRWLRYNLDFHPDVFASQTELSFFNNGERFEKQGVEWYATQFEGWAGEPFVGEATPGYMMWRHRTNVVAERIQRTVPDVRLVAMLRNPVDRAHSAMIHHIAFGKVEPGTRILDLVGGVPPEQDPLGIVAGGWYAASLEPYFERFGEQLLVVLHDDVSTRPQQVYEDVLRHLGAPTGFVPPDVGEVRFSTPQEGGAARVRLTAEERVALYEYFRDDVRALEQMIGRDLSSWDPTSTPASAPAPAADDRR